jgi:hypothetical protein
MYMKHRPSGDLVEVLDINALMNPSIDKVSGRFHAGEELQDAESFNKTALTFPSDEELPRCWTDPHYRE